MKTTITTLALLSLCGALPVFAADKASDQIEIEARFIDARPGKSDVLSAPKVTTLENQEAMIEVLREIPLVPENLKLSKHVQTVKDGITLQVTASIVEEDLLLKGSVARTTIDEKSFRSDAVSAWGTRSITETHFVVLMKSGETRTLDNGGVRVELTAKLIPAVNAATLYWQAFAALPPRPDAKDAEAMKAWTGKAGPALDLLHQASAVRSCDWGLDFSQGFALQLPHVSKITGLAKAAVDRAKSTATIDPAAAQEDLRAVLRASRHVTDDPLLITQLVGIALQSMALEVVEPMVDQLPADQVKAWKATLQGLPPRPALDRIIEAEKESGVGGILTMLDNDEGYTQARAMLQQAGETSLAHEDFRKMLEQVRKDYDALAEMARLPVNSMRRS